MALYTKLDQQEIVNLLVSFGLPPPRSVKGILEGTVNTYYKLSYPECSYFLKIDEVGSLKRLLGELKIFSLLNAQKKNLSCQIPFPLKTTSNKFYVRRGKKFILLFKTIPGKTAVYQSLDGYKIKKTGKILGQLHGIKMKKPWPPHRFTLNELLRVFLLIRNKLDKKHPDVSRIVRQWLNDLKKSAPQKIRWGLIHADLFPENILFMGSSLTGIVDFEAGGAGPFLFDIAVALHALCHDGKRFDVKRCRQFLSGYQTERPLDKKEKKYFEYYLVFTCLRFLLTRLRDFELKEGAVPAKPFKDYREFLNRFSQIPQLVKTLGRL